MYKEMEGQTVKSRVEEQSPGGLYPWILQGLFSNFVSVQCGKYCPLSYIFS